uniref:One cut domain family member n=1 Tax=Parastrongyloides trichosuri TaxID=131310 RepID=A0A0N4ZQF5_PARTI
MEPPAESSARIGRTHSNTTQQRYDIQNSQMLSKTNGSSGRLKKPKEEEDLTSYFDLNNPIGYSPSDDLNSFDDLPENFLDTEETPQSNLFKSFAADSGRRNGNSFNNNTNYEKDTRYHRSGIASSSKTTDLLSDLRQTDSFPQDGDIGTGFETVSERRNGLHQTTYDIPPQGSSTYVSEINQVRGFDKEPISNVELASSMISTLEGDDSTPPIYDSYDDMPVPRHTQRIIPPRSVVVPPQKIDTSEKVHEIRPPRPTYRPIKTVTIKRDYNTSGYEEQPVRHISEEIKTEAVPSSYDIEEDEMIIDTAELCRRIAFELKKYKIPQVLFAEKIIGRSQGTLSDLLRNPKPWDQLKTGKSTFKKMFDWVNLNQDDRLSVLGMDGNGNKVSTPRSETLLDPPSPAPNARHGGKTKKYPGEEGPAIKKPRLIFSDVQKRTLQAIFKETERPSKEMQQTIAEHLGLDPSTVSNYFMNARRRSRNTQIQLDSYSDNNDGNPITPPPETPNRRNTNKRTTSGRKKDDDLGIGDPQIKNEIDEISEASM